MNEFTKETIISIFTDEIEDAKDDNFDEYRNNQFNLNEYIIGRYQANEALNHYVGTSFDGALGALQDIYDYTVNEVGLYGNAADVFPSQEGMFDPEKVATQLAWCLSDFYLNEILAEAGLDLDDEIDDEAIAKFKNAAKRVNENNDIEFF